MSANVRIYDLAKELKQEPKRIIEDLRREGADVSVPSNSVSNDLAEKVRNKYFPKVEASPKRGIKVIKKKNLPEAEEVFAEETQAEEIIPPRIEEVKADGNGASVQKIPAAVEAVQPRQSQPITGGKDLKVRKVVAKPKEEIPAVEEAPEEIAAPEVEAEVEKIEAPPQEIEPEAPVEEAAAPEVESPTPPPSTTTRVLRPTGTQVKQLKLTQDALNKGIKPGEKIVTTPSPEEKARAAEKAKDKGRKRGRDDKRPQLRGTEGENKKPQTVYIPPTDQRRKFGRSTGKKIGGRKFDEKDTRYSERDFDVARPRSIEDRILDQVGKSADKSLKQIRLTEGATVRDFAEALGITPRDVVQLLIKRGIFATLNQPIGESIAEELGVKFGYQISFVPFEEMMVEQEFEEIIASEADDNEVARPPVVTVMGHVDHGKTSLLDAIRSDNVAEGEAGGITQHIGAYSVFVANPDAPNEQRRVVFLDTPGHEAFTMMRARGAKATDVVILVVAADDGVMPQTIEAIEHSKAANVPIIVAINKIDKPDANADKVKQGLAAHGLQPIDWGGETEMVPVSAKQHQNLDNLLETVLLQADIMDLKASPTRRASGVVLEAKLDKGRGAVATVLVQQGTLRVGDPFIVGQYHGKVRAMFSDRGEIVSEAPPATPVEVLGLQGVPQAGDTFQVVSDIEKAQNIAGQRQMHARQVAMLKTTKRGIESLGQAEIKELLVVLKADVQGSVEVLRSTLEKLSTEKVKVRVIRSGVGAITESDVLLASATQADAVSTAVVIIGFNVRPGARAEEIAKQEEVDIRLHSIIYKVEEEIRAAMIGMLDAIEKENILGKAVVQETFKVSRVGTIAGCRVTEGVIRRQARARLVRDGVVIWTGDIASLKRFKEDTNEVRQGFECGISLVNFNDLKVGDEIEAFVIEKIAATEL
jgi:translation initiation factor IF-2